MTESKACTVCFVVKNLSAFGRLGTGYAYQCKACKREQDRVYREKNSEKIAASQRDYYQNNKESIKVLRREHYANNKELALQKQKQYYSANIDSVKAYKAKHYRLNEQLYRVRSASWRIENRERYISSLKAYRAANLDDVRRSNREYFLNNRDMILAKSRERRRIDYRNHPEKHKAWSNARRSRKRNAEGRFNGDDVKQLLLLQKSKCACCRKSLRECYHIDHVVPLKLGGGNMIANIQLLCPPCNHSKSAKDPIDFMQQRGFLL